MGASIVIQALQALARPMEHYITLAKLILLKTHADEAGSVVQKRFTLENVHQPFRDRHLRGELLRLNYMKRRISTCAGAVL